MRNTLLFLILLTSFFANGQITTPIVKANFGVDADVRANFLTGTGVTGSADDWFNNGTPGSGRNVIDSTGAAAIIAGYNSDASPWPKRMATFYRGMSLPLLPFLITDFGLMPYMCETTTVMIQPSIHQELIRTE